jgi:uncharacterized damage-inducible protein DinB
MTTTSTVSAVAGPLASIFATNDSFINRSIAGLTEDDLWHRPTEQSNPMFWLLGHVVHTRGAALRILGDEFRTGWGDRFQRGAALQDRAAYPAFAEIERFRAETRERLASRLATVTDEQLAREATGHPLPNCRIVADQIAFLGLHEAYHVGQLAYVRKMLGHASIVG